jgi:ribose 5-phosphate isomerase B
MNIALAADHAGYLYKEKIKKLLESLRHTWDDYGTYSEDRCDYPDFAHAGAEGIISGECERGIFICGTGLGIAMAAGKHPGIRAASCQSIEAARMSRMHNDANVLCLGSRLNTWEEASAMIRVWMETPFEGGRHERRVRKIDLP